MVLECFVGFANLALTGKKHQNIAFKRQSGQFINRIEQTRAWVAAIAFLFIFGLTQRPPAHFYWVGTPRHFNHGGIVKMLG